jgi:hypothetical protein
MRAPIIERLNKTLFKTITFTYFQNDGLTRVIVSIKSIHLKNEFKLNGQSKKGSRRLEEDFSNNTGTQRFGCAARSLGAASSSIEFTDTERGGS